MIFFLCIEAMTDYTYYGRRRVRRQYARDPYLIHPFISDHLCIAKNYPYVAHLLLLYVLFDLCTLLV